ncbi:hypothetical protein CWI39_0993p0010 [Hamiltosporidium magnivora]|uniref:Uncharacterized protein n=1 Tax=Hamiltosporidium magnivora TaxID=148818 RepID=A0A4Q9L7I4_9MICR|nr:hypothetical protein CWI39_0993p0010 [Hamiltosporidium magnivora]
MDFISNFFKKKKTQNIDTQFSLKNIRENISRLMVENDKITEDLKKMNNMKCQGKDIMMYKVKLFKNNMQSLERLKHLENMYLEIELTKLQTETYQALEICAKDSKKVYENIDFDQIEETMDVMEQMKEEMCDVNSILYDDCNYVNDYDLKEEIDGIISNESTIHDDKENLS